MNKTLRSHTAWSRADLVWSSGVRHVVSLRHGVSTDVPRGLLLLLVHLHFVLKTTVMLWMVYTQMAHPHYNFMRLFRAGAAAPGYVLKLRMRVIYPALRVLVLN